MARAMREPLSQIEGFELPFREARPSSQIEGFELPFRRSQT
jgi:hypothetical protein